MYEELVKRLRDAAHWADKGLVVDPSVHYEAANAIDELNCNYQLALGTMKKEYKRAEEEKKQKSRWIPVTKMLPENIDDEVLVCTEDYGKSCLGFVTVAIYDGSGWLECWKRKTYLTAVTHWMPLPKPPKENT